MKNIKLVLFIIIVLFMRFNWCMDPYASGFLNPSFSLQHYREQISLNEGRRMTLIGIVSCKTLNMYEQSSGGNVESSTTSCFLNSAESVNIPCQCWKNYCKSWIKKATNLQKKCIDLLAKSDYGASYHWDENQAAAAMWVCKWIEGKIIPEEIFKFRNLKLLEGLVQLGADVNQVDYKKNTPLYYAVYYCCRDMVLYLLQRPEVNTTCIQGSEKKSALSLAFSYPDFERWFSMYEDIDTGVVKKYDLDDIKNEYRDIIYALLDHDKNNGYCNMIGILKSFRRDDVFLSSCLKECLNNYCFKKKDVIGGDEKDVENIINLFKEAFQKEQLNKMESLEKDFRMSRLKIFIHNPIFCFLDSTIFEKINLIQSTILCPPSCFIFSTQYFFLKLRSLKNV